MPRSKMEPGSHGEITYHDLPDGRVRGTVSFRRIDGSYGKLRIRASSKARARRTLSRSGRGRVRSRSVTTVTV